MPRSCFFALLTRQLCAETCHRADLAIHIVLPGSRIPRCPRFAAFIGTGNDEEAENRCRWNCRPIRDAIIDINFLFIKIEWTIRIEVEVD